MLKGQRFYIKTDTLGIHSSNGPRVLVVIPKHAIVEILSETFNSSRMIDVTWEGKPRMMFMEDLREHGKEIADFKAPHYDFKVVHYQDICFLDSNAEVSHREATIRLRVVRKTGTPLPIESNPIGKGDSMNGYHHLRGCRYRLSADISGISTNGKTHLVTVPAKTIVIVIDGPFNGTRLVDVLWKGETLMMFTAELREHGEYVDRKKMGDPASGAC